MQIIHDFLNRGVEAPHCTQVCQKGGTVTIFPLSLTVHIKDINVACPELLETGMDGHMEGLVAVSRVVHLDRDAVVSTFIVSRELDVSRINDAF